MESKVKQLRGRLAVVLTLGSVLCGACSSSKPEAQTSSNPAVPATSPESAPPSTAPLSPQDGERVTAALLGTQADTQNFVEGVTPDDAQLPAGSGLSLAVADAVFYGDTARVPATVTGSLAGDWIVLLIRVDNAWRIYGTTRA